MPPHIPAQPLEKLFVRMKQAEETGKEFDEALERRVLGLQPAENPIFRPATKQREELTLREDREGARELEEEARQAAAAQQGEALTEAEQEIARLKVQIAKLQGDPPTKKPAKDPTPITNTFPTGKPNRQWSRPQLKAFLTAHNLPQPAGGLAKLTNAGALEYVLEQSAEAQLFETPTDAEAPATPEPPVVNVGTEVPQE